MTRPAAIEARQWLDAPVKQGAFLTCRDQPPWRPGSPHPGRGIRRCRVPRAGGRASCSCRTPADDVEVVPPLEGRVPPRPECGPRGSRPSTGGSGSTPTGMRTTWKSSLHWRVGFHPDRNADHVEVVPPLEGRVPPRPECGPRGSRPSTGGSGSTPTGMLSGASAGRAGAASLAGPSEASHRPPAEPVVPGVRPAALHMVCAPVDNGPRNAILPLSGLPRIGSSRGCLRVVAGRREPSLGEGPSRASFRRYRGPWL
jgi:hypothetical protein